MAPDTEALQYEDIKTGLLYIYILDIEYDA